MLRLLKQEFKVTDFVCKSVDEQLFENWPANNTD